MSKLFQLLISISILNCLPASNSQSVLPKLSISGTHIFTQAIECELANATELSLSVVPCSNRTECQRKLWCLSNNSTCSNREKILKGDPCSESPYSDKSGNGCLVLYPSTVNYGLVQCTGRMNDSAVQITTDYFYKGVNYYLNLLSNSTQTPSSARFTIKIDKNGVNLNTTKPAWNRKLYTGEELRFSCTASQFFYNETTLRMTLLFKNKANLQINPKSLRKYNHVGNTYLMLYQFRMRRDIVGFQCSADVLTDSVGFGMIDGQVVTMKTQLQINFTTIDPPQELSAISSEDGKYLNFSLNQTLGCNYNGSRADKKDFNRLVFSQWDNGKEDEVKMIKSITKFLRFREFADGLYGCKVLNGKSLEDSLEDFQYLIQIVQEEPAVLTNSTEKVVRLKGHDYRTLSCKYSGIPRPFVNWFRNGERIMDPVTSTSSVTTDNGGDDGVEESRFLVPVLNSTEKVINYTCVAYNHLGQDNLTFMIDEDSPKSFFSSDLPANSCATLSWLLVLIILAFLGTLVYSVREHLWAFLDRFKREDQQQLQLH